MAGARTNSEVPSATHSTSPVPDYGAADFSLDL